MYHDFCIILLKIFPEAFQYASNHKKQLRKDKSPSFEKPMRENSIYDMDFPDLDLDGESEDDEFKKNDANQKEQQ